MFIKLDMAVEKPIYMQLKEQIIEGIARKELKPGDDLPSVRALAADIGINLHTVNKVYQQLKQEGYIQIQKSRGVFIHPDGFPQADEKYIATVQEELRPVLAASICHGLTKEEIVKLTRDIYDDILNKAGDTNE